MTEGASNNKMKQEKDKWVNEALESLNGMEKATASPFLEGKIMYRISGAGEQARTGASPFFRIALTGTMALFLALNIYTGVKYLSVNRKMSRENMYEQLDNELGLNSKVYNY